MLLYVLQSIALGVLAYCIWRSLRVSDSENLRIFSLKKDAAHISWSDEWNGSLINFHSSLSMQHIVGGHDFPRLDLSEVSTRMWSSPSMMSASVDWMAKKPSLWDRFRIWLWRIRHNI